MLLQQRTGPMRDLFDSIRTKVLAMEIRVNIPDELAAQDHPNDIDEYVACDLDPSEPTFSRHGLRYSGYHGI
jgi:hypothetical protein